MKKSSPEPPVIIIDGGRKQRWSKWIMSGMGAVFVALGEHYIEILTSRDVDAVVAQGVWDKIVADFIAAVKADRLAAGLADAVGASAAVLSAHFPREAGAKGPSPKP